MARILTWTARRFRQAWAGFQQLFLRDLGSRPRGLEHPLELLRSKIPPRLTGQTKLLSGLLGAALGAGGLYALGGLTLALRLYADHVSVEGGLAVMPRDYILLVGARTLLVWAAIWLLLLVLICIRRLWIVSLAAAAVLTPLWPFTSQVSWPIALSVLGIVAFFEEPSPTKAPDDSPQHRPRRAPKSRAGKQQTERRKSPRSPARFGRLPRLMALGGLLALALTLFRYANDQLPYAQVFEATAGLPNRFHQCELADQPETVISGMSLFCVDGGYLTSTSDHVYLARRARGPEEQEIVAVPQNTVREVRVFSGRRTAKAWSLFGFLLNYRSSVRQAPFWPFD